jgi:hypothetical protein
VDDQTRACENCGAPLPRTGTYCLACDTPVSGTAQGLSVAETESVRNGRPIMGIALIGGIAIGVLALVAGMYLAFRPHSTGDARQSVTNGVTLLVKAEGGKHQPCKNLTKYLAGKPTVYRPACREIIGHDPGAHLRAVRAGATTLNGSHGTVHLSATLVDDSGSRHWAKDFPVVQYEGMWRLDWNGSPII